KGILQEIRSGFFNRRISMFTGIIESLGKVEAAEKKLGGLKLRISSNVFADQKIGDSISVNGVCLTISGLKKETAEFDVMGETLDRSSLSRLKKGESVNLERALRAGDRLGGHFVTGHIDCTARIIAKVEGTAGSFFKIELPKEYSSFVVQKGSVSAEGVSLTISDVGTDYFKVDLIPHTLKATILGRKRMSDIVNIEFDILGKYSRPKKNSITEEYLREKGFC
ncbi:MAG: riboflavin synthase, partial [Candidatus Omnitrophica bacterium]|nr:riboflavin synthase [Candidatus Omnitrophota bacterium]